MVKMIEAVLYLVPDLLSVQSHEVYVLLERPQPNFIEIRTKYLDKKRARARVSFVSSAVPAPSDT
jgi:hypothetical protein